MYLIGSKGLFLSHSVKEYNFSSKSFSFEENDIIFMEYNPFEWMLVFIKNLNEDKFEMPIVPPS